MTSNLINLRSYSELRAAARAQLKGNWGKAILVFLIFSIITGLPGAVPVIGFIISMLLMGPLQYGVSKFFLRLSRSEASDIETIFDGFKAYTKTLVLGLLIWLFTTLWSLLAAIPMIIAMFFYAPYYYMAIAGTPYNMDPGFIIIVGLSSIILAIPAIIAAMSYSQAYFIMIDNPGMEAMAAIKASKTMMKGHKGSLFILGLTFIGWGFLTIFTFGIGVIVLMPYVETAFANFYNDLKAANAAVEPVITVD